MIVLNRALVLSCILIGASINGNMVPPRPAKISDRRVLSSLGKPTQEIQDGQKQLRNTMEIKQSPYEYKRQPNPTKTTMKPSRFLGLPKSHVTRKPFKWYDYENRPTTKRNRVPYEWLSNWTAPSLDKSKVTRKPFNWYDFEDKPTTKRYRVPYDWLSNWTAPSLDLPKYDFKPNDYKPSDYQPAVYHSSDYNPSSSGSSWAIIGPVISGIISLFSITCFILRMLKRSRGTIRRPGIIITRSQNPDGMGQSLLNSNTDAGGQQHTNVFLGQGNELGGDQQGIGPPTPSGDLPLPSGQLTTRPTNSPSPVSMSQHITALVVMQGMRRGRLQRRLQMQNELQDILALQNDPVPDVDPHDPVALEAVIDLTECSRRLQHPVLRIEVRRATIVEDLIKIYRDMGESDLNRRVISKLTGEEGVDGGGVTKDIYTTFWQTVKEKYFRGNIAFVPQINLGNYDLSLFTVLGRIFSHTTLLLRAIPIQICRSSLNVIIYGEMEMADCSLDTILDDFFRFLDLDDRLLLQRALQSFDELDETDSIKLGYIFEKFEMANPPERETLRKDLSIIAYNELCVKPRAVCQKMGKGIPTTHREEFWGHMTLNHLNALYEVFRATPVKVIEKLRCLRWPLPPQSNECQVFNNLKRFIGEMSEETLLQFLQFVTAERKVPNGQIIVQFSIANGVARVPKAHTCVNALDLPISYTNYDEFQQEFTNVLFSDEAMEMNME